MAKTAQLTLRIAALLKAQLEGIAGEEDRSVAYIVERALEGYVKNRKPAKRQS